MSNVNATTVHATLSCHANELPFCPPTHISSIQVIPLLDQQDDALCALNPPSNMPFASAKSLLFLALFGTTALISHANDRFDKLYNEKIEALSDVSSQLINALEPAARCRAAQNCNDIDCLPNACSHDSFGKEYKCSNLLQTVGQPDFCSRSCDSQNRLLNLRTSTLTTPPGTLRYKRKGRIENIEVPNLELRRDVCAFKRIHSFLAEAFNRHKLRSWLYVASKTGLMMTFPGTAHGRTEPSLQTCGFVPMIRPWYIAAASGSKDVVFLFDRTSLTTTEKVLPKALVSELERLRRDDYVAVIAVSGENAEVLLSSGSPSILRKADESFKETLVQAVHRLPPSSGQPVMKEAIEKAFDILQESEKQQQSSLCSRIIVILAGNAPACFKECNKKSSSGCTCTADIVTAVQAKQARMGERKVSIVAFTEGMNNDAQRMARSIVCASDAASVWQQVQPNKSSDSALSAYTDIGSLTQTSREYTSDIYIDGFGLGDIFTIARPMYERETNALVGVSGVDITITEVADRVGGRDAARAVIEDKIRKERRSCSPRKPDSCAQQKLRARYGGICADVLVGEKRSWKCYRAGSSLFFRSEALTSWEEARANCQTLGSGADLAVLDNDGKNELVAAISAYDGSWIGLRAEQNKELEWISGSPFEKKGFSFNFDYEIDINRLHEKELIDACVAVDRRGTSGNWNIGPCDSKRMAICEVKTTAENVSSICPQDNTFDRRTTVYEPVHRVDCDLSETVKCSEDEETALENANPLCPDRSSGGRSEFDRRCCGGRSDTGPTQCQTTDKKSSSGAVIGGAVGAVIVVGLAASIAIIFFRRKRKAKRVEGQESPPLEAPCADSSPPPDRSEDNLQLPFPKTQAPKPSSMDVNGSKPPNDLYDGLDI
ncbi:Voltage-dependent calcium channel subunit alpha-2/delta-4 [Gracilariopsis chorda]|uniref:Voltage-dependent calcium channel subunit alpha-2/delta-4 n=1 Tax=Gracilariopsis chorda TaxID=448386 RepID=A0A2V3IPP0_9FLOR|nr:Voltage-dependent calcium channel subunit alpha-2/delta-4 [Gracilariopsis chorda]|eukprot:PXF44034.1 Voltage-dependent calcium channel subunit alpha-2/delta-4 [Gracilariopsis chorda]